MSESRFEAGLRSLTHNIMEGMEDGAVIQAKLRTRLLPLLEAAEELLNTMETCHICKAALELQDNPVHCEDCSGDCENHDEPECKTIQSSHVNLKRLVSSWQGK